MAEGYVVRRAVAADAEALTDLHLDCWDDAYTGLVPQQIIDGRRAQREQRIVSWGTWLTVNSTSVAEEAGGRLVGFVTWGDPRDDESVAPLELMSLYTRARVWGTGVGHDLLLAAIGDAPAYLWVLAANPRAIAFYANHGFRLDGAVRDDPSGVDARMVR